MKKAITKDPVREKERERDSATFIPTKSAAPFEAEKR